MNTFFEKIRKHSYEHITKSMQKELNKCTTNNSKLNTLKLFKFGLHFSSIIAAITFFIGFILIGLFANFISEQNALSLLYQVILFVFAFFFIKISLYFFLSITYSIEKISQLILNLKLN
jgi:hypothetical protein